MLNIRRETLGTIVILHSTTSSLPHWTMSSLRAKYFACSTVQQLPHAHNPLWNWDAMSFWAEKTQNQFSSVQFSCPSSWWCQPTISSSVTSFSCLHSFPASGSFPVSQLFTSGGPSIGASASTSVLPMNTQDWFPLQLTGWISLQSKGLSRVFSNTTVQKHQFFGPPPDF